MERFNFIFLVAGLGFFALAFAVSGYIPMIQVQHMDVRTIEQMAEQPPLDFLLLKEDYPEAYKKAFGDKSDSEAFAEALVAGHRIYIGEACWHCHSQQVRPWGNDEARYGQVSFPEEYHNELNMPPLWGTRRVGPDLVRRGGKQSNDWHVAHFYHPPDVNPVSVMPSYPWFYEDDGLTPNKKGLSIIAYVQWLGSWTDDAQETIHAVGAIERNNEKPNIIRTPVEDEAAATKGDAIGPASDDTGSDGDGSTDGADDDPYGESSDEDDPYGESSDADNPYGEE